MSKTMKKYLNGYLSKINDVISDARNEITAALKNKGYDVWSDAYSISTSWMSVTIKGHYEDIDDGITHLNVDLTEDDINGDGVLSDITVVSCELIYIDNMVDWANNVADISAIKKKEQNKMSLIASIIKPIND